MINIFKKWFGNKPQNQQKSDFDAVVDEDSTLVHDDDYSLVTLSSIVPMVLSNGDFKYTKSTNLTLQELIDLVIKKYKNPKGLLFAIPIEIDEFSYMDIGYSVFGTHADNYLIPYVLFACEYGIILELKKPTDILLKVHGSRYSLFCDVEVLEYTKKVHTLVMTPTDMPPQTVFSKNKLCLKNVALFNAFAHTIELKEADYDLSLRARNSPNEPC